MAAPDSPIPARILFVDHTARLGGGEIALFNLIAQFDRRTVEPIVVLLEDGPLRNRLAAIGCEVRIIPLDNAVGDTRKDSLGIRSLFRIRSLLGFARCLQRLGKTIQAVQPALVHTNSLKADILGGLAAKWAGFPVLWHVRDRIADDYLPPSVAGVFRILCRLIPDRIIANSYSTLQTLGSTVAARTRVVHDGTDISTQPAACDTASHKSLVVGLVGRLAPWKGQHIFIEAAASVLKQFPEARFRLIGAALFGEERYELQIRDQVQALSIIHAVEFYGFRQDVYEQISQLDLVVHASTTAEPFGQVVIEAMAAAKPVIATAGGGVLEIVVDGATGLLVPMNNASAMAAAMAALLSDPSRRRSMGECGRARVIQHFSIQQVARNVESVYRELLEQRAGDGTHLPAAPQK